MSKTKITYNSNNSGGSWWLTDDDWFNLEKAGWVIDWYKNQNSTNLAASMLKDNRFLGALASKAYRVGLSLKAAVAEWEEIVKQDPGAEGCPCCGRPHYFYEDTIEDDD